MNVEAKENPIALPVPQHASLLGSTLRFKGELSGTEDLIIKGKFRGKLDLDNCNLIVEKNGKIKADIRVKNITIKGLVEGNVHASGKINIEKEGKLIGDIVASRISIMEGAQFKGSMKMLIPLSQ